MAQAGRGIIINKKLLGCLGTSQLNPRCHLVSVDTSGVRLWSVQDPLLRGKGFAISQSDSRTLLLEMVNYFPVA